MTTPFTWTPLNNSLTLLPNRLIGKAVAGMLVKEEEVVVEARAAGWGTAVNVRVAVAMAVATEVDAVAGNVMAAVVAAATRAAAGRMAAAMAAEVDVSAILAVSGSSTIFQRRQ
jgi:hypothetical protein